MSDQIPAVDPTALDRLLDMTGGDAEFVDELVETFLEDAVEQFAAMLAAAETGAINDLIRPAHSLKSNSANMGADRLEELCRALEADARSGSVVGVVERVTTTEAEFERVRIELLALRAPQ